MCQYLLWLLVLLCCATQAAAQIEFERAPISYHEATPHDPISQLQQQLDSGEQTLEFDPQRGYLPAVLKALNISPKSQVLVFSKTSLQLRRITPEKPRAVYFNDDNYIGWVQQGDVVEISTVDPQLGAVFYTLDQQQVERPRFIRDKGQCITCHASSRTKGVPGHLMRSVFADDEGQPQIGSGTFSSDHTSPFSERWGGWYVTGTHGSMRHMGNSVSANRHQPEDIDREKGANVTDLNSLIATQPYLTPHSDLVALMVLEHQIQMHNLLTLANFETRSALHYDQIMNAALDRPEDHRSDSTQRRIASATEKVVQYMLLSNEFPLTAPVAGTSGFQEYFEQLEPLDPKGRSLRQLDLEHRLFKYPCSFLIRSRGFRELPVEVSRSVKARLREILASQEPNPEFAHLTFEDRTALEELLAAELAE